MKRKTIYHGYIISIEQNLIKLCDPSSFGCDLTAKHLKNHLEKIYYKETKTDKFIINLLFIQELDTY